MRPTVLLFDIDGTLISTGGAGRRAMERAFDRHHGRKDACASFSFDGMTDRAILRTGLAALGKPTEESAIDELIAAYLELLQEEVTLSSCRIHEGIELALSAATAREGYAVGLGTGNVRAGARVKLSQVGIYERFAFGGFGCDHEDRGKLLRMGAERGARALNQPLSACRVVVIGDTPKDIAAAKAIDAECIAVATGSYTTDELMGYHPTFVFRHLADSGALLALLP